MTLRAAALVLLLGPLASPQETKSDDIPELIRQLGDDDVAVRDRASGRLSEIGPSVIPRLQSAATSGTTEVAARAREILRRKYRLRIILAAGKPPPYPKGQPLPATFVLCNTDREDLIYLKEGFQTTIHLLELFEEPPQEGRKFGDTTYARGSTHCALNSGDFGTLAFGQTASFAEADLRETYGLQIADEIEKKYPKFSEIHPVLAGRYRIDVRYRFDRAAYITLCRKNCAGHADPTSIWNRCPERTFETSAEVTIR